MSLISKKNKSFLLLVPFFIFVVAVISAQFFQTKYQVTWVDEQESFVPTESVASNPALDNGPAARSNQASRMPAAAGPQFIIENKVKKLVITLKYVCSSWLYLAAPAPPDDPAAYNTSKCNSYAALSTAAANRIYSNSKIPVFFRYTVLVQNPRWGLLDGKYFSRLEMQNKLVAGGYATSVNPGSGSSNPDLMPAIEITNFESRLRYTAPTEFADAAGKITIPTRSQSYLASTVRCNSPTTLSRISNFEKTWGIKTSDLAKMKVSPFDPGTIPCGTCPNGSNYGLKLSASTSPFDTVAKCEISCICTHYAGRSGWGLLSQNVPTGVVLFNPASLCGAWPGNPNDASDVNECGYPIRLAPEYWQSTADTKYFTASSYVVKSERAAFNWLKNTVNSNLLLPGTSDYSLVVMVRPFGSHYGVAGFLSDFSTKTLPEVSNRDFMTPEVFPTKENFFKSAGGVVVTVNAPWDGVVAHEVGHILGGWHERDNIDLVYRNNEAFAQYTQEKLKERKLGAYVVQVPGAAMPTIATVMYSTIANQVDYFSTRSFTGPGRMKLGVHEDNRQQIVKTLSYLAGENLETIPTREAQVVNVIQQILNK